MKQFGHIVSSTEEQFSAYEAELAEIAAEIEAIEKAYEKTIKSDVDKEL